MASTGLAGEDGWSKAKVGKKAVLSGGGPDWSDIKQ